MRRLSSLWPSAPGGPRPLDYCYYCCCCSCWFRAVQVLRRCRSNWWPPADLCTLENPCHCTIYGWGVELPSSSICRSSRSSEWSSRRGHKWGDRPRTTRNAQQLISSATRSLIKMSLAYEYCDSWCMEIERGRDSTCTVDGAVQGPSRRLLGWLVMFLNLCMYST